MGNNRSIVQRVAEAIGYVFLVVAGILVLITLLGLFFTPVSLAIMFAAGVWVGSGDHGGRGPTATV